MFHKKNAPEARGPRRLRKGDGGPKEERARGAWTQETPLCTPGQGRRILIQQGNGPMVQLTLAKMSSESMEPLSILIGPKSRRRWKSGQVKMRRPWHTRERER